MNQLGGHAIFLDWNTTNFKLGGIKDEIKSIARYCNMIMARVYDHKDIEQMAKFSDVPVINGLSDFNHPCQAIADLMTIKESHGMLEGLKLAYIGDGNNVCNSLIMGCAKVGMKISIACPKGYEPDKIAVDYAKEKKADIEITNDPKKAIEEADIIYTDTWVSMGQEAEKEKRIKDFKRFQLNKELIKDSNASIMHCLPAHEGYEITRDIIESKNSIIFDQAENRMHAQKAIILKLSDKS